MTGWNQRRSVPNRAMRTVRPTSTGKWYRSILAVVLLLGLLVAPVCAPLCAAKSCANRASTLARAASENICHHSSAAEETSSRFKLDAASSCPSPDLTALAAASQEPRKERGDYRTDISNSVAADRAGWPLTGLGRRLGDANTISPGLSLRFTAILVLRI